MTGFQLFFINQTKKGFMYQNKFEQLGNSKWSPVNIGNEGIELFVFKEGNLNMDHLDAFFKFMFEKYKVIKVDYFMFVPDTGACLDCKIFYLIFSEYEEGDSSDILIYRNRNLSNYTPNNCSNVYGEISYSIQYDLTQLIKKFDTYSYEVQNKNYNC
jgi:hypothetical protein